MSAALRLRGLVRPSVPRATWMTAPATTQTASFAAKPSKPAAPVKNNYSKGRSNAPSHGKTPAPGERKALRKRIQLSNTNALPVPGLVDARKTDLAKPDNIGRVFSIPGTVQDQLRAVEAFKPTQFWHLFRNASTLVRAETVDLARRMDEAAAQKQTLRLVYDGPRISGKSLMLLQGMAHGFLNDWIVINVPDAQELTTAVTEYAPIPDSAPTQYMQNNYCLRLLQTIRRSNERLLARLTTAHSHPELPQNIPINSTLLQLISAAKEPEGAWLVFHALWKELMQPKAQIRPPVLFCLDGLAQVMRVSDYRSAAFEPIHAHDLALVRLFVDALSGAERFPCGGAVVGATSRNNLVVKVPSMELALAQRVAQEAGAEVPQKDPFFRGYDERVLAVFPNVSVEKLGGMSRAETRSLLWYWEQSGLLRQPLNEATLAEKWTLGGHGIVGEMERASLLTMRL